MNMIQAISEAEVEDRKDARYWLLWTIIGNLPLWILLIPLLTISQSLRINLAESGEFALFSISLLSSALYVVTKQVQPFRKDNDNPNNKFLGQIKITFPDQRLLIAIIVLLGGISLIPVVLMSLTKLGILEVDVFDSSTVTMITLLTFIISLFLGFLITLIENSSMKHKLEYMSPQQLGILQEEIRSSLEGIPESLITDFEELENE